MNLETQAETAISPVLFSVNLSEKTICRFWDKVRRKESLEECWEWSGAKSSLGYGSFSTSPRKFTAPHRLSYFLAHGPFPKHLSVCHKCDNPPCCNPHHLFLGTHLDNMRDMYSKNRRQSAKGENHASAKLTQEQVVELRARYSRGEGSMAELGSQYGITRQSAHLIISRQTWRHI